MTLQNDDVERLHQSGTWCLNHYELCHQNGLGSTLKHKNRNPEGASHENRTQTRGQFIITNVGNLLTLCRQLVFHIASLK